MLYMTIVAGNGIFFMEYLNPFAIMLAQLKTVVLLKEAIQQAFFRPVSTSRVKRQLQDGLLGRVAKEMPYLRPK